MRSTLGKWILFGVVCYVLLAIFTAPANLIFNLIGSERIKASGVNGSAWNGTATSVRIGKLEAQDVRWKLKPLALLGLSAGAEINAKIPGGAVRGDIRFALSGDSGNANKLHGVVKLGEFASALNIPLMLDGKLGLQLDHVQWKNNIIEQVSGDVLLGNMMEPNTNTELGSFEIAFPHNQTETIKGIVKDTAAIFKLRGTIALLNDGHFEFDALIEPTEQTPSSVLQALQFVGATQDSQGNFTLSFNDSYHTGHTGR